jgi:lipid II:glycine glycyltransferase (peptidoglycan interpeptide bridge formation enzyme)
MDLERDFMTLKVLERTCETMTSSGGAYTVETDGASEHSWNNILQYFEDANLIQSWSYGATRWGEGNLSHVLLQRDGEVVAAAQSVIVKLPLLGAGMAYVKWGPLWQLRGRQRNEETFRRMLQALREVYVVQRGLLLRVFPAGTEAGIGALRSIFKEEGFERDLSIGTPGTAFIDLSHSLEEIRSSLKPAWRRNLKLAEQNQLTVIHGVSDELLDIFVGLYTEMQNRKNMIGQVNIDLYKGIQRNLPDGLKMRVMICEHQGEPVAGIVVTFLGNMAQNHLAATGDKGLHLRASYLLHWRMLEWLKAHGCRWLDLDALNHQKYPGISQFKLGLAGRLGWEAEYPGQFESCTNAVSHFSVRLAEQLRTTYRDTRVLFNRLRNGRYSAPP